MLQSKESGESKKTLTKAPPAYINENYIRQALECYFSDHNLRQYETRVNILECKFDCIAVEGANNCSDIYKVRVKYELFRHNDENDDENNQRVEDSWSLIVKDVPIDPNVSTNEMVMFKHVLPKMDCVLSKKERKRNKSPELHGHHPSSSIKKLFGECLFCERGEREIFVLGDLMEYGYGTIVTRNGLDLKESIAVMKKLAEFHGASMWYLKEYPSGAATLLPSKFVNGIKPTSRQAVMGFEGMSTAIKMVEKWTGFVGIAASMRIWMENFNERLTQVLKRRRCRFNVITHGELWTKNILMRYVHQRGAMEPCDAVFMDFRWSFIGGCGYDLNFFFNTSVNVDVLAANRCDLLRCYYEHLLETIMHLGFPKNELPTWDVLLGEVYDLEFIGYYAMLCLLPMSCVDPLASTEEREKQRKLMYENERVQAMFRQCLPRFYEMGVFDCVTENANCPTS